MSIWKEPISLADMQQRSEQTLAEHIGIVFTEVGDDCLTATMPVDDRTKQPIGLLHGGASCVLAETVGSTAANYCVDQAKEFCVGLDINANHLRAARSGIVTAVAKPVHLGRSTQVWQIDIFNEQGQQTCSSRLTMAVVQR